MKEHRTIRQFVKRTLVRIVLYPVVLLIMVVLYLSSFGVPAWVLRDLQGRVSTEKFVVEMEAVKIDMLRGLVLEDVKLYRKHVVGPAAAEAARVVIGIDPLAFIRGGAWIRAVSVSRGTFQPAMLFAEGKAGRVADETPMDITVDLDDCTAYSEEIEKLTMRLHSDQDGVQCEDIAGVLRNEDGGGPFKGRMAYDSRTSVLEGRMQALFDLHALIPAFEAWNLPFAVEMVNRFDFGTSPPHSEADFRRSFGPDDTFRMNGRFWFENALYRDVSVMRADGHVSMSFSPTNSDVAVGPLVLVRKDGMATGSFTVDAVRKTVAFDGESSIDPKTLARMIGIFTNGVLDPWRFDGTVKLAAKGLVGYGSYSNFDFEVAFDGRGVGLGRLEAQDYRGSMRMTGTTSTVSDVRGRVYGGEFLGRAVLDVPPWNSTNDIAYSLEVKVKDADFEKIMKSLTQEKRDYAGQFSGNVNLQGWLGTGNGGRTRGEGFVKVREGRVYMMPVFGGLSSAMARIVPGLDLVLRQNDASAEFVIADGKIHTDKALVEGDVLSLSGHGDYHLDGRLDFNAQVKLMKEHTLVAKLIGFLTYPISKLFEFRLRGTIAEPRWYAVNFSRDLLEKIGLEKEKEEP